MIEIGIEVKASVFRARIGHAGFVLTVLGEALTIATRLLIERRSQRVPCLDKRLIVGSPLTRHSAAAVAAVPAGNEAGGLQAVQLLARLVTFRSHDVRARLPKIAATGRMETVRWSRT